MDYNLAKTLKDEGFPMQKWEHYIGGGHGTYKQEFLPTLSELIEACHNDKRYNFFLAFGGHFENKNLIRKWRASLSPNTVFAFGSTPEEACALLWLELNKDENTL